MQVIVLTSNKYRHLIDNFSKLYNKFWGVQQPIHLFCFQIPEKHSFVNYTITSLGEEDKSWGWQLCEALKHVTDDQVIIFREDFYLLQPVDFVRLGHLAGYMRGIKAKRASLQCVKDGYEQCSKHLNSDLFMLDPNAQYLCSMELSIWDTQFLKDNMNPDWNHWEAETELSKKAAGTIAIVPSEPIVIYADATRNGGQKRIDVRDNGSIWQLKPGDVWIDTGVTI